MDPVETKSTRSSAALLWTEQAEDVVAPAAGWPPFSAPELRRLRFVAYRRATGRLRPSAPLGAAGVRLAAEIAVYLRAPAVPQPSARQEQDATVGVPHLWRTWLEARAAPAPPAPSAGCR